MTDRHYEEIDLRFLLSFFSDQATHYNMNSIKPLPLASLRDV